jgi:hypothetical protein
MMFLTDAYGFDPGAISWQSITYTDWALFQSKGGLDPFVVRQRDFEITSLSPWAQMKIRLAIDAVWLFGWVTTRGVENKITVNNNWTRNLALARGAIPMNSGGAVYIDGNLDREVGLNLVSFNLSQSPGLHRCLGAAHQRQHHSAEGRTHPKEGIWFV